MILVPILMADIYMCHSGKSTFQIGIAVWVEYHATKGSISHVYFIIAAHLIDLSFLSRPKSG